MHLPPQRAAARPAPSHRLSVGDRVRVNVPNDLTTMHDGRLTGFYAGEQRRIIVRLPSGKELVAQEADVSLIRD